MDALTPHEKNTDQAAYWNGPGGQHWTDRQEIQDAILAPVSEALIARAGIAPGESIVDIGCGCGGTTLALAAQIGASGHALGLDISSPMLARAQERTPLGAPVQWVAADATVYPFERGNADLLFSRFGVMFFADPALSFANMRGALRSRGRLAFACWREPRHNPWLMLPLQAAYQHAPRLPELGPEDPGPFSFASQERVNRVLSKAGFSAIAMQPVDLLLDIAVGAGLDAAVEGALEIGPASRALQDQSPEVRSAAAGAIRAALAPHLKGESVPLGAATWIVTATNP
jgi:ubiquinone/menaquinone biosynthesis C-methylase UbiE